MPGVLAGPGLKQELCFQAWCHQSCTALKSVCVYSISCNFGCRKGGGRLHWCGVSWFKRVGPGVCHHSLLNLVKVRGAHGHLRGGLRGMLPAALGSRWYWINRFPLRSHFDSPANISNPKFELFNRFLLIHLQSKILSFGYIPQLLSLWERTWNDARANLGESALRSLGQIHEPWGGHQKKSELWGFQKNDNIKAPCGWERFHFGVNINESIVSVFFVGHELFWDTENMIEILWHGRMPWHNFTMTQNSEALHYSCFRFKDVVVGSLKVGKDN